MTHALAFAVGVITACLLIALYFEALVHFFN